MYGILIQDSFGVTRDELMERLRDRGIETRAFFIPVHRQPAFVKMGLFRGEGYPVAEVLSREGLYLPSGSGLTEEQIQEVCGAIREIRGV
jgi:perosamine synthetase